MEEAARGQGGAKAWGKGLVNHLGKLLLGVLASWTAITDDPGG